MVDGPVIASVSGGKDSAALCLWLQEQGIKYRAVHMDTKWEHPETDRYIREVLDPAIGPIEWIEPPLGFADLARKKTILPSRKIRFCTQFLKLYPLFQWIEQEYGTTAVLNAVGIRAEESPARANLEEREHVSYGEIWRPLLRWSVEDVIAIHKKHGLPPNPLYLLGAERVGCWPCIFARKSEIAMVARMSPERIVEIAALEAELTANRRAKDPEGVASTFFSATNKEGKHVPLPINDAVAWSRTSHGGKQIELLNEDDRSGCMRWGMCDT